MNLFINVYQNKNMNYPNELIMVVVSMQGLVVFEFSTDDFSFFTMIFITSMHVYCKPPTL